MALNITINFGDQYEIKTSKSGLTFDRFNIDEKLKKDIEDHIAKAKATGKNDVKFTVVSGGDSLREVIKTKEQADLFMKMLKSL